MRTEPITADTTEPRKTFSAAAHAISCLGLQHSLAHPDDLALAAKHVAAALAWRVNLHREGVKKEIKLLLDLAHGLAESGRFAQEVTTRLEVVPHDRFPGQSRLDNLARRS
ncbi:hypothetical protein AB0F91_36735 [Amycolatopsis sp. NPDC023774]|uniref:hypothetical protein n=1 Tax=Amycolatopsis sp. NPDC023774 TaxID=3155015 RepID=UPI0033FAA2E4